MEKEGREIDKTRKIGKRRRKQKEKNKGKK